MQSETLMKAFKCRQNFSFITKPVNSIWEGKSYVLPFLNVPIERLNKRCIPPLSHS